MEVAHLDGDVRKELSYSRSAVQDNCLYRISHILQHSPSLQVCLGRFCAYFPGIEILLEMGGTEDADPEAPCEEGDIGDEDDRVRGITMLPCWCVVNTVPYPVLALPVFLR